jgi:hypothetical protein
VESTTPTCSFGLDPIKSRDSGLVFPAKIRFDVEDVVLSALVDAGRHESRAIPTVEHEVNEGDGWSALTVEARLGFELSAIGLGDFSEEELRRNLVNLQHGMTEKEAVEKIEAANDARKALHTELIHKIEDIRQHNDGCESMEWIEPVIPQPMGGRVKLSRKKKGRKGRPRKK